MDNAPLAVSAVAANLTTTGLQGGRVVRASVLTWLAGRGADEAWPLVFADPPYAFDDWQSLLSGLEAHVTNGGLIVLESDREIEMAEGWQAVRSKRYGATVVTIAARHPTQASGGREP